MGQPGNDGPGKGVGNVAAVINSELLKLTGEEKVREFLRREALSAADGDRDWNASLLPHITLISSSSALPHPKLVFAFTVQPEHCNRLGNLHGGCTATLFDLLTTMPLSHINSPGFWWYLGVSRTLNVTYLRPMPMGETFHIECEIVHVGKRLATLKGVAKRPSDGALMAVCEHGKVNTDPPVSKM